MKLEIIVKTSILLVSSYHFGLHLQLIHFAVVRSFACTQNRATTTITTMTIIIKMQRMESS